MNYRVYLFDFDGTLVDSMPCWSRKVLRILEQEGIEYPADILKTVTPLGDAGTARYFQEKMGLQLSLEEIFRRMDEYAIPQYRDVIPLKAGVKEAMIRLKEAGCSINVLTASPHKLLDDCLKRNGIYDLFEKVWSCDDFHTTKADPDIYVRAAACLGVKPEDVVFLDDNINAVRTAKSAGMAVAGVYDDSGVEFADELRQVAHWYVDTFEDFTPL